MPAGSGEFSYLQSLEVHEKGPVPTQSLPLSSFSKHTPIITVSTSNTTHTPGRVLHDLNPSHNHTQLGIILPLYTDEKTKLRG